MYKITIQIIVRCVNIARFYAQMYNQGEGSTCAFDEAFSGKIHRYPIRARGYKPAAARVSRQRVTKWTVYSLSLRHFLKGDLKEQPSAREIERPVWPDREAHVDPQARQSTGPDCVDGRV
jgi:hypothetical protein